MTLIRSRSFRARQGLFWLLYTWYLVNVGEWSVKGSHRPATKCRRKYRWGLERKAGGDYRDTRSPGAAIFQIQVKNTHTSFPISGVRNRGGASTLVLHLASILSFKFFFNGSMYMKSLDTQLCKLRDPSVHPPVARVLRYAYHCCCMFLATEGGAIA